MSNASRLNETLLHELAAVVNREIGLPEALITISYVDCSPDLKVAKVGFSILPDKLAGTALRKLQTATPALVGLLRSRLRLRRFPRLVWEFDATEREADKIDKLISGIDDDLDDDR